MKPVAIDWTRFLDWRDPLVLGTAVVVLLIVLFATGLYVRYRIRSGKARRWISGFGSILQSKPQEASWMEFIDVIDEKAAAVDGMRGPWTRFRESLLIRLDSNQASSSQDPREFFDFWELYESANLNPRMLAAIPNILTGAGILGTFVGLTLGLAGLDATEKEVSVLMEGIGVLLSGASLAFLTSIAGITSSIVFSVSERRRTKAIAVEFESLVSSIRSAFPLRTSEAIAEEMLEQLQQQRVQLEKFNTDFAVSMAQALEGQLRTSVVAPLTAGMTEVVQSIQGMREDRSESTEHALTTALDNFRDSLHASTGREMNAFQDTFREIDTALRSVIHGLGDVEQNLRGTLESVTLKLDEGLTGSASRFGAEVSGAVTTATTLMLEQSQKISQTMDGLTKQIEATLSQSTRSLGEEVRSSVRDATSALAEDATALGQALREEVIGANQQFRSTLEGLIAASEKNQALLNGVGAMLERTQAVQSGHDAALQSFQDAHRSFASVASPLAGAAQQLSDGLRATSEAVQGIRTVSQGLDAASQRLEEHNQALTSAWSEYRDRFEAVDASLAKAFNEVNGGTAAFAKHVREYVESMNRELAKALSQLSGAVSELDTTVETLAAERTRK